MQSIRDVHYVFPKLSDSRVLRDFPQVRHHVGLYLSMCGLGMSQIVGIVSCPEVVSIRLHGGTRTAAIETTSNFLSQANQLEILTLSLRPGRDEIGAVKEFSVDSGDKFTHFGPSSAAVNP